MAQVAAQAYALAFFELTEEEKKEKQALEELTELGALFTRFPDYLRFLSSPLVDCTERCGRLEELLQGRVMPYTLNFLKLLVEKRRICLLQEITVAFEQLYDSRYNIARAQVTTAVALGEQLAQKLVQKLEQVTGKTVLASFLVDPAILGGVIVKFENEQFDSSVRTRLETLKSQLAQGAV